MTDDHDDLTTPDVEPDGFDEEAPLRSIFTTAWFRVLVVVIAVSGLGVIATPYLLDWLNPPPPAVATVPPAAVVAPPTEPTVGTTTVLPAPPAGPPAQDRPVAPAGEPAAVADRVPAREPSVPAADRAPAVVPETVATPAPVDTVKPKLAPPAPARAATKRKAMAKAEATPAPPAVEVPARAAAVTTASAGSGTWWVQIGSFRDEESARRLAARLREQSFTVAESVRSAATAPAKAASGPDQYDVYVSGLPAAELTQRVTGRGLSAEAAGNDSVVVRPSLPLREAVMLSKDLAVRGLRVQVKRAQRAGAATAPPAEATAEETWHRVRIGPFPDREAAQTALQDAQAKGYKPFLARGDG